MKIVIDTIPLLSPLTGVGIYTYQIAKVLREIAPSHEYTYFYGYYSSELKGSEENRRSFYRLRELARHFPYVENWGRSLKDFWNSFSSRSFDLYLEPHFFPLEIRARHIVATVHDFSIFRFPQWQPKDKVRFFQKNFWPRIKKADRIITGSDYIREEAIGEFGFPPGQVIRIYYGVDHGVFKEYPSPQLQAVRDRYRLPETFILSVGAIEPRKNLDGLLRAYRLLDEGIRRDYKLVLAGFAGWENKEIMEKIQEQKGDVFYIGYLPKEDLARIYNLATLFVYPSFYEGFGLPPLEAMACGCPVLVSKVSSLPEVCGNAAYYVDPKDIQEIAEGIYSLLTDPPLRESLSSLGAQQSGRFSWQKSAGEHLKVFEEISAAASG